jgi:hypothetical protein
MAEHTITQLGGLRAYNRRRWARVVREAFREQKRRRRTNQQVATSLGIDARTWQRYLRELGLRGRAGRPRGVTPQKTTRVPNNCVAPDANESARIGAGDAIIPTLRTEVIASGEGEGP